MKFTKIIALAIGATLIVSCQQKGNVVKTAALKTVEDSVSYAIGMQQGQQLLGGMKQLEIDTLLNKEVIVQAFINALNEAPAQIEEMQGRMLVQNYVQSSMAAQQQKQEAKALEDNADVKKAGEEFLAENAKKSGVTVTPSGLQYEILKEGKGPKPTANNVVKVHYHGTLIDGTVFDSSVERGEPTEFGVTQVIQGWVEALQLMPVGSKWKLYIPQELAYGGRAMGETIKPYSALIFEVELLAIVK
ncbi:MAG TPA: FKBP-type peptidyl-prolyl cis-trans isomerase [Salinivirgaceae bacterium]|nr:FKBP-type peptidyl-prolyl cis-trans isomerase [Salinivirgaceae bacterium]